MRVDGNNANIKHSIDEVNVKENIAGANGAGAKVTNDVPLTEKKDYELTISEKAIIDAIEDANKKLSGAKKEFEFSIHKKTKSIMVKVINKDTDEVIREIPSEKILDMVANFMELSGIFVDEKR